MANSALSLICLLLAIHSVVYTSADSINGCGGFIEASSSLIKARKPTDGKLDYSHITVELRTVDGLVKDSTQCAPNGYYFIPVYDKGSFILKVSGPEGWSWSPDKVPVNVDNAGCNGNEDINFQFTGFTVSGKVTGAVGGESCQHKNGGPSNVQIDLLSAKGDLVSSASTSPEGKYIFKNVVPGGYTLRASHPELKLDVRGPTEVELGFGNGAVDDIFFVPGYDIHGSVAAQGNPILGVHIYLYSDDIVNVNCPEDNDDTLSEGAGALCHTVSDVDGTFSFKSLPCGTYKLKPFYKGENTVFDVSPPIQSVSVKHQHVSIPQKFQVTGFSVGGRVIDGNDMGVEGVKIIVDGQVRSITDKLGYYKLDQVTSNRYTIEAVKEHYKFSQLKEYMVLPNMAFIADIKAVSYDVCGKVRTVAVGQLAKVALTHGPENVKPQVKQTDESGSFCFQVSPGEYRLSAVASTVSVGGLLFLPREIDVVVKSPVLNLEFSQAMVNIHGNVVCKEKCGSSVSVSLTRLANKRDEERNMVELTDESSEFSFAKVFPGKYRLKVKHSSLNANSGKDDWCWEQNFIDIDVGADDVNGVVFIQKGYWIKIISTHDVDAVMTQPNGSPLNLKLKKGPQQICVEYPGVHELHFIDSCIFFGSSSVKIDTSNPSAIHLKGEKYLLKGQINVVSKSVQLPDGILVDIVGSSDDAIDSTTAKLTHDVDGQKTSATFEYTVWANVGDKITFIPRDSRDDGEKKILFYPPQQLVSVTNDGCQSSIAPFSGRLGLYIEGSVSPPIGGVEIKIIAAGNSDSAPLKKGGLALQTTTNTDGSFTAGPLYDDISYIVEGSKPGYHIKRTGPNSFSCQKLGQISVRVYSKDDVNEPIPSVLLSLSGDDGYRNNSVSSTVGNFLFDNLFPGSFYLRPLLKEYAFSPAAQAIELGSGESKEIVFQATRVAYSATGTVTLLSGQPKEGVSLEARSESKGYYEATLTDSYGNFRLRGLLPDTTYVIRVVSKDGLGSTRIERASPDSVSIKVQKEDIKGMDFVVFEQPERTILSSHVEGQKTDELHSHLRVEIKSATDPSKVISVFPLPLSNFFQVKDLPRGKHVIQLRTDFPSSAHRFESEIIEVDLEKNPQIHVGPLRYKFDVDHNKQDLTAAPVLPLVVGVSVILLFISIPRLKELYQGTIGGGGGSSASGFTRKEVKKAIVRKKTY